MGYVYFYRDAQGQPLTKCPSCDFALDIEEHVTVVLYYGDGKSEAGIVEQGSYIDPASGELQDDNSAIYEGNHSGTLCGSCGVSLNEVAQEIIQE